MKGGCISPAGQSRQSSGLVAPGRGSRVPGGQGNCWAKEVPGGQERLVQGRLTLRPPDCLAPSGWRPPGCLVSLSFGHQRPPMSQIVTIAGQTRVCVCVCIYVCVCVYLCVCVCVCVYN